MLTEVEKWRQTIVISWNKFLAYRLNFFLQVVGPVLVFFFVKYSLWSSLYAGTNGQPIGNYTLDQMISYHVWGLVVTLVAVFYYGQNMSEDIRMGRISSYLIYPFNFWQFHTASWIAYIFLQILIATITVAGIWSLGLLELPSFSLLANGLLFCLAIGAMWFTLQFLTGICAFWLEETWILRVLLGIVATFLSGGIIPLDLYPEWLWNLLSYTPFPYFYYLPVRAFMGQYDPWPIGYVVMAGWTAALIVANWLLWRKGVRLYTAAGM